MVEVQRLIPAGGRGGRRHTAHYIDIGAITFNGGAGSNTRQLVTTNGGHKLPAGTYRAEVSSGGPFHDVTFRVRR
jgi:hypothetical protein